MASNSHIRAILRLRGTIPKRQTDLLLALETFTPDDDGWREAGANLIESETGVTPRSAARARGELIAAGWLDYDRGDGRGHVSRYRVRLPYVPKKGRQNADPKGGQNAHSEGSQDAEMATFKGRQQPPVKVATEPDKGRQRNPAASANAIGALKKLAPQSSASRPRDARAHRRAHTRGDLDGHPEGARNRQGDDDDFQTNDEPGPSRAAPLAAAWDEPDAPGYGQCPDCGRWTTVRGFGLLAPHYTGHDRHRACPGSGQPPVEPVRCIACGTTGKALTASGRCGSCHRIRRAPLPPDMLRAMATSQPANPPKEDPP